jgi:hypothetical protein
VLINTQSLEVSQEGGISWPRFSMKQLWMKAYGPVVGSHAIIVCTTSSKLESSVLLAGNESQKGKVALGLESAMRCELKDSTMGAE